MPLRMDKVNKEIQRQLMSVLRDDVDDPALTFLSITNVDTTRDLRESKVYFSILDDNNLKQAQNALKRMKNLIRAHLGNKLHLKILPDLRFIHDDTLKYSVDIFKKIEDVIEREKPGRAADDDEE
ncbi:MAG: 30S ribosome-binding factor RbfA [Candidatus Omnitrophica bacterium]|nr:30S ribosome-binding factor RbfA [Candidatus Omnitrophota bacterium]MDD5080510.1 30S ribosome-binding factor RbfA [Candidatus Omnitrophota bacterium]